ncbi:hypothetical protein [Marinobacter sp. R17]|uniref:hypothetical protein n=1 Tax=Marinobacter sp. R17 TaxID=2484250 RepID=UPI000F4C0D29|nr:hypothetical protein [Marinobacter sp. R17]
MASRSPYLAVGGPEIGHPVFVVQRYDVPELAQSTHRHDIIDPLSIIVDANRNRALVVNAASSNRFMFAVELTTGERAMISGKGKGAGTCRYKAHGGQQPEPTHGPQKSPQRTA